MEWKIVSQDVSSEQADKEIAEYKRRGATAVKEGEVGRYSVKVAVREDGSIITWNQK
jgi:hypothetical protein